MRAGRRRRPPGRAQTRGAGITKETRMKRFHVHVAVPDLAAGIAFYSTLFGDEPSVRKDDYAKWMLDEPRLNFAISQRDGRPGVNHLGFQVDSGEELEALHAKLRAAGRAITAEKGASCCYARSDKYWTTDPAGIAWESFHTLGGIPMFGAPDEETDDAAGGKTSTASARRRRAARRWHRRQARLDRPRPAGGTARGASPARARRAG
jgi:catechol 2,3-dioxygenase-like lactoylglutathione lyase family enzyme